MRQIAALFDLDGVILDTEKQYTQFWKETSAKYLPQVENLDQMIKGQTLIQILDRFFPDDNVMRQKITDSLNVFEGNMNYAYVPGILDFVQSLREAGTKTAIVTSSNHIKMEQVYQCRPELRNYFNAVLTAEDFQYSKPHPDCYLRAAGKLNTPIQDCVVFEDSVNGLRSGHDAGMFVVGLTTTNPRSIVEKIADYVIPDFTALTSEKLISLLH